MRTPNQVTLTLPATTANLGPGFDCLGLALTLYNRLRVERRPSGLAIEVRGEGAGFIPRDASNLVVRAFDTLCAHTGHERPGLVIIQENLVPVASGLGSSSTAIVGGLLAANALMGAQLPPDRLLALAAGMEGHADNAAPALFGGFILVNQVGASWRVTSLPPFDLPLVVVLPEFDLKTAEARSALPSAVPIADAAFNAGRTAWLLTSLQNGDFDSLRLAMQDRLHQPYRMPLIPGMEDAFSAAYEAGAAGVALSGAGPALLAIAPADPGAVANAAAAAFRAAGLRSRNWQLRLAPDGALAYLRD